MKTMFFFTLLWFLIGQTNGGKHVTSCNKSRPSIAGQARSTEGFFAVLAYSLNSSMVIVAGN